MPDAAAAAVTIWFVRTDELPDGDLVGDDFGGLPASVFFVDMPAGRGPKLHKHAYGELFFLLEGEAIFSDGREDRVVGAGEVVVVSADQPHRFVNSGSERLRLIAVHLSQRFVTEWLEARD